METKIRQIFNQNNIIGKITAKSKLFVEINCKPERSNTIIAI